MTVCAFGFKLLIQDCTTSCFGSFEVFFSFSLQTFLVFFQHPVWFNHRNLWSADSACILSRHSPLFITFVHFCLFYCTIEKFSTFRAKMIDLSEEIFCRCSSGLVDTKLKAFSKRVKKNVRE